MISLILKTSLFSIQYSSQRALSRERDVYILDLGTDTAQYQWKQIHLPLGGMCLMSVRQTNYHRSRRASMRPRLDRDLEYCPVLVKRWVVSPMYTVVSR